LRRRQLLAALAAGSLPLLAACSSTVGQLTQPPPTPPSEPNAIAAPTASGASPSPPLATPTPLAVTATPTPNPNDIAFLSWIFDEPGRRDAWRAQFAGFNQSQSTYRVRERYLAFGEYAPRVLAGITAGDRSADVLMTYPEFAPRLINSGVFSAVDDVAKDLKIADRLRPGVRGVVATSDGLFGFDSLSIGIGLLYNRKRYADANVKAPPTSPDEWVTISQSLTDKGKTLFGFYAPYQVAEALAAWFAFQVFALPYDGKWAEGNKPLLTSDPIVSGVRLFKRLYDVAFPQGVDSAAGQKMFIDQNVAQIVRESTLLDGFRTDDPELYANLASAAVPWPTRKSLARVHPLSVLKSSPKTDAAKAWLRYLYTPANYVKLTMDSRDFIPMYPITTDTPGVSADLAAQWARYLAGIPAAKAFADMAPVYVSPSELLGTFVGTPDDLGEIVIKHLEDVLVRSVAPDQAMADAQKEAELLAARPTPTGGAGS
jgi:ABC-type glycerol-3-phosphate transport system substrate-binding protein